MKHIPTLLILLRLLCAPGILALAIAGASRFALLAVLAFAFLSDIFDGIIARRLGVATENLRRADTVVDSIFYLSALAAIWRVAPAVLRDNLYGIIAVGFLEAARYVFDRIKFGKQAAYHTWLAKFWGITIFLGFSEAFYRGASGSLFQLAIVAGIVCEIEGLCISFILKEWQHDIATLWHALKLGSAKRPAQQESL